MPTQRYLSSATTAFNAKASNTPSEDTELAVFPLVGTASKVLLTSAPPLIPSNFVLSAPV